MDLPEDFDNRASIIFTAKEMSELLIMIYVHLSLAVHLKCDKLILTPTELSFMSSGHKVWMFPIAWEIHSTPDFYRRCFLKVFERDTLVQKLFGYEFSDGGDLVIKVGESTKSIESQG